jgi:mono/diheme cytochrome c family protein
VRAVLLILLGASVGGGGAYGAVRLLAPTPAPSMSPYDRGHQVALRLGCFTCHGPEGKGGTNNFLPELDEVPSWSYGTFKSYVTTPAETKEWILDGLPARMKSDAAERDRVEKQLIQMPAYRGKLSDAELNDLVFYLHAVATFLPQEEDSPVAKGRAVAARLGCFGCHGGEGRARPLNPGSFKGYIPAWDSKDYEELVQSPEELAEWVVDGAPKRLRDNPAARFFMERQLVKMPAYGKQITREELTDLSAYIGFVRGNALP